jgi:diguanylate cyclase (GGDEF)-like protein
MSAASSSPSFDVLTGLLDRATFTRELEGRAATKQTGASGGVLVVLDIVKFRSINYGAGLAAGDDVLRRIAAALRDRLAPAHAARLGGNEFGFILDDIGSTEEARAALEALGADLEGEPFWAPFKPSVRLALGAALPPGPEGSAPEWLQHATIALGVAKKPGCGGIVLYSAEMGEGIRSRVEVASWVREALGSNGITAHYQPKVALRSGKLAGFEALLRWHHPTEGLQLPGRIAAAFEDPEFAFAIADRMLDRVLADVGGWVAQGIDFPGVSINFAAAAFGRQHFAEHVLKRLAGAEVALDLFEVEVTEHVILDDASESIGRELRTLADQGIRIALDDFGRGCVSLQNMALFPISSVKMDRPFIQTLARDSSSQVLATGIISVARSLGIKTVAEGVETEEQATFLLYHHCDLAQGFLFSEPLPSEQVPTYIENATPDRILSKFLSPIDLLL